jgi:photosystem II stability/assembly factor-like uncharacterized protein
MSDPFDPVDNWLGTDIELLPPRPGAFERVHRRAKRRKTVVAMASAAGAAVAIAAAATLPQVVSIGPSHGNPQTNIGSASHSPSARPGHHRSPSPAPGNGPTTRSCISQPAGSQSISTSSQRPTPGLEPSSVTFVSQTVGAVIGEATAGSARGCEAVAATSNYGLTWTKVDPPPAGPPNGNSGVSQIRFLEARNGWAYGPGLYVTHDGGAGWVKATGVHGRVIDLATVGASVYAVVASCTGAGSDYAGGCTRFALYTSAYNSDHFRPVPGVSGQGQEVPGGLELTNRGNGYLLVGDVLFSGAPDGSSTWQAISISSGKVPACLTSNGHHAVQGESGLLAPGGSNVVYLLCQPADGGGGSLYTSTDAGATWRPDGHVKAQGLGTSLAVAPNSNTLVLATNAGIYYSADTRHWSRAKLSGQAPFAGFGYVGMTTQLSGVAVPSGPGSTVIYITTDGGSHWHPKRIA